MLDLEGLFRKSLGKLSTGESLMVKTSSATDRTFLVLCSNPCDGGEEEKYSGQ